MFAWCAFPCAKPSQAIQFILASASSTFPKQTTHTATTNNTNNMAFLLMMTHALSYAQSQLWLRFFFLRASLSLPLLIVCWESVNCDSHGVPIACPDTPCDIPNTHIPYSISAYRLLFFTFFWPFVIDEGSFVLRWSLDLFLVFCWFRTCPGMWFSAAPSVESLLIV